MFISVASRSLIQPRAFQIFSWAKKGYKSSRPVRYVPGAYTQVKKIGKSSSLEGFEKKGANLVKNRWLKGAKNAQEASSFDNKELEHKISEAEFSKFSSFDNKELEHKISEAEFMESSELCKNLGEISGPRDAPSLALDLIDSYIGNKSELFVDEAPAKNTHDSKINKQEEAITRTVRQDVENTATELLAARAFTAFELRKKLCGKKYPVPIVGLVIADLKCRGFLNDGLYAESFSRSKWLSSNWGPRRIKQALIQKGVREVEADKAMKHVFEDDNPSGSDASSQFGMSELSMDRLLLQASKQWLRGQETTLEKRKARMVRWLQYRGFNWEVTNSILKKLQSHFPP